MKSLRWVLSIAVATYMTGAGNLLLAQETNASPFSITLAPLQYADVKGNVGKFEALNWMPNGAVEGGSVSFVKDINKDISLNVEGSEFTNDDGNGQLTLQDGDKAFLHIDYNAFRKYYDGTGGVYPDQVPSYQATYGNATPKAYVQYPAANIPGLEQGVQANSPDLQLDISYFKLEAGLGPISDPFLDVAYEHNSKNGDKSLLQWAPAYNNLYNTTHSVSPTQREIGPSWMGVNDTVDTVTLKEKKDFAGITFKGDQTAEVDYNNNSTYMQYLSPDPVTSSGIPDNAMHSETESPDAKLFGSGVRAEKWMLNDNTYAAFGYHYNHVHDTDTMQTLTQEPELVSGVVTLVPTSMSGWNISHASEDDHVWVGNFDTNLTHDLTFSTDARYEHMGSEGDGIYYSSSTSSSNVNTAMENHQDLEGEHAALRYSGIPHTTFYAETDFEQQRNWVSEDVVATTSTSDYLLNRIDRTQNESWTVGGRIVPNRFFTFSTQVKQHDNDNAYDTVAFTGPAATSGSNAILLDSLREKGVDETSTLAWKPYHWLQNSLKYQFSDTVYNPQEAALSTSSSSSPLPANGVYPISENHMLTSQFTYDITVEPIDPLLLMISYSHVENYVRTLQASQTVASADYQPTFNSGDNSWLFSSSYTPLENLTWTSTVCYTLSNNYVDFSTGVPYGSDFKMLNLTTGLDWTYHKWLKIGPKYEHASYRDNALAGDGNYSANIFMLTTKFTW